MPTGPKGEKRPADVIGNAVSVMRIATGEETENLPTDDGKDPAILFAAIEMSLRVSNLFASKDNTSTNMSSV
jgi:hypothetical protein